MRSVQVKRLHETRLIDILLAAVRAIMVKLELRAADRVGLVENEAN